MSGWNWRKAAALTAVLLLAALAGTAIWLSRNWPFTQAAVTRDLQGHLNGRLTIGRFRETFFPPGCVASDLRVDYADGKKEAPKMAAGDLIVQGSWHGLLTHTLQKIKVVGLHIEIPAGDSTGSLFARGGPSKVHGIGEVEFNDSEFKTEPLYFQAKQLVLDRIGAGEQIDFRGTLVTDKPRGELSGKGRVGPWKSGNLAAIPISGTYSFQHADLHTFSNLKGILAASGKFDGNLQRINVAGVVDIPQFHVDGSAQAVRLMGRYQAAIDTNDADTQLEQVEAHVGHTFILGHGDISGTPGSQGKTAHMELVVNQGRVEDLLNYFSEEKHPSMTGAVKLHANAVLPPGPGFLKKLQLTGDFGVAGGKFTGASRQTAINDLSASAWDKATHEKESKAQEDTRTAISNLRGHVAVREGNALLSNVSLDFPGATSEMGGNFNLLTKGVDIHGTLQTTGTISQAASGFKALMLKVATPFLKKKQTTVVPFAITGTASNPKIGLDLKRKVKY